MFALRACLHSKRKGRRRGVDEEERESAGDAQCLLERVRTSLCLWYFVSGEGTYLSLSGVLCVAKAQWCQARYLISRSCTREVGEVRNSQPRPLLLHHLISHLLQCFTGLLLA
ncbi:hypothetical protein VTK73DRAFT_5233 [Phialemonium thermophilum]|uniref:Uncharacterized protein n=1 Tax=Phialemonium thermophilum TaxID=223376 RepID=A0ABR3V2L8_9PEZI